MEFHRMKMMKLAKWGVIGGFAVDAACLAGGYYYYQKLKNSQDFRYQVYKYDSRWIDVYYRANEKFGDGKARQQDLNQWGVPKTESFTYVHLFGL